jgi:hypothetical protein
MSSAASNYDVPKLICGTLLALLSFALTLCGLDISRHVTASAVFYTISLLLYGISMFASSYVEEEHNFWYLMTSTWFLYLIFNELVKSPIAIELVLIPPRQIETPLVSMVLPPSFFLHTLSFSHRAGLEPNWAKVCGRSGHRSRFCNAGPDLLRRLPNGAIWQRNAMVSDRGGVPDNLSQTVPPHRRRIDWPGS